MHFQPGLREYWRQHRVYERSDDMDLFGRNGGIGPRSLLVCEFWIDVRFWCTMGAYVEKGSARNAETCQSQER